MNEAITSGLFYGFAAISVALALAVVTSRRILRAAVYLMGVLVASAAFFLLLGAEFLAGVQILVYVGGIVVLLVFAVMLTRSVELLEDEPSPLRKFLAFLAAGSLFSVSIGALWMTQFPVLREGARPESNVAAIGRKLLDYSSEGYVLPFEIISLLLLSAVIGGIVIARKTEAAPVAGETQIATEIH